METIAPLRATYWGQKVFFYMYQSNANSFFLMKLQNVNVEMKNVFEYF